MEIRYLLFDCDNTLALTEDVAFEACADVVNEIMEKRKLSPRYTPEDLMSQFVGFNFRGIVVVLQQQLGFRLSETELQEYITLEETRVIAKLEAHAKAAAGSIDVLTRLRQSGKYKMAVVSSSSLRHVRAILKATGQSQFFESEHVYSAASSLSFSTSPPDPALYLHVLREFHASPKECVAVEDSRSGAMAAIKAKIPCLGYIGSYQTSGQREEMAGRMLFEGCKGVMWDWSEFDQRLAEIEAMD